MANFTDKQQAFINEYVLCLNATEAAKRAGYSTKTAYSMGHENLRKPEIAAEIKRIINENTMSAEEVLLRLSDMARGSMGDFIHPDSLTVDLREASRKNKLHLIKSVKYITRTDDEGQTETVEFSLYDAQRALQLLGKYHELFTNRIKVDDWRSQAIDAIRKGEVDYPAFVETFGDESLAQELFRQAGVPVATGSS